MIEPQKELEKELSFLFKTKKQLKGCYACNKKYAPFITLSVGFKKSFDPITDELFKIRLFCSISNALYHLIGFSRYDTLIIRDICYEEDSSYGVLSIRVSPIKELRKWRKNLRNYKYKKDEGIPCFMLN